MRFLIILLALFLVTNSSLFESYNQFKAYSLEYGKKYESKAIELYRFAVYLRNMITIRKLNNNPLDNAVYG